ncbi:MAG: hypothetical protein JSR37_10045 [Verrucomicrobia bacterium]|nr:hypothetical protein [Verrucomicrobiota bacterium]MBS0637108.1 hypothetical protein [Verrucomicrobiota bacterium]
MRFILFMLLCAVTSCQKPEKVQPPQNLHRIKKDTTILLNSDGERNPRGSVFFAERMPDTYIENVGQVATYRFVARKFPPEASYLLSSQNLGAEKQPVVWYEVDDDGQLGRQIDAGTLMLDNEMILMFDYCKGEPVEYWLTSGDGDVRLKTTLVPYPIHTQATDGAALSLRRITRDASLVLLEGTDFNPDEEILVSTQSGSKRTFNVPFICRNGCLSIALEPGSPDKSGGIAYVDILRRTGERLSLEYDWGCEAVNPKKRLGNTQRIKQDALLNLPTEL